MDAVKVGLLGLGTVGGGAVTASNYARVGSNLRQRRSVAQVLCQA